MRTPALAQSRLTLLDIRAAAERRADATLRISSGIRVSKPSDSPSDAAGIVRTSSELARIDRFQSDLETTRSELRAVDGALSGSIDVLQRALVLATQAANTTLDAGTRAKIGEEISGLQRHLVSIGNTVHNGRHVFAGGNDQQAPFDLDLNTGEVAYTGDSVGRAVTLPDGRPASISLPGDEIFLTPDEAVGAGRTPQTTGLPPDPPIGVGVSFSGGLDTVVSVDLEGHFVASAPPAGAAPGDVVTVTFTSKDNALSGTVSTPPLAGGEDASAIALLLNGAISADPQLAGQVSLGEEGGALRVSVSESAGVGFDFSSSVAGSAVTGLESGGSIGGFSAEEIAAALNDRAAQNEALVGAGVRFSARDGELVVDGDVDLTIEVIDYDRGTDFRSGLAGVHRIGGAQSGNVFGTLDRLATALRDDDVESLAGIVDSLQRGVDRVSQSQGFYGATLNQVEVTLDRLNATEGVNVERLSAHRDADLLAAIGDLQSATAAEEAAIQVAGRDRPTLLDVIG